MTVAEARRARDVSNRPFREELIRQHERGSLTFNDFCKEMGWTTGDGRGGVKADNRRMKVALGMSSEGRQRVSYRTAVKLCRVLDIDPVDVGI